MTTFESPFAAALNRLLESEPWARERLAPFAGETLELRAPPLPALRFTHRGRRPARPPAAAGRPKPSLVVTLGPGALAAAVKGEEHLLRAIRGRGQRAAWRAKSCSSSATCAGTWRRNSPKCVGDVAAHRLAGLARGAAAWHADAAQRIAGSLVEYAAEEKPLLVKRAELEEIAAALAQLRDGLERLEKRIERLRER